MPQIKFSHLYKKLISSDGFPIKNAKLILVSAIPREDISRLTDFIQYDTEGKYILPFCEFYLLFIFLRPDGEIFTEVRPRYSDRNGNKEQYYRSLIGQDFEIIING